MLLVAGTVPIRDFPLTSGTASLEGDRLTVGDLKFPCGQGTGAMLSAAVETAGYLGIEAPRALLAGDLGDGKGSKSIYEFLIAEGGNLDVSVLALHYLQPIMIQMKKVCESLDASCKKPLLVADAGSMYAAKAAGVATAFDVFTPDSAELAFLADPQATHPAYIGKHLFQSGTDEVSSRVRSAYGHGNAATVLVVKGSKDLVVKNGKVLHVVEEPDIPEMEAIGGTGDTITGMVAAFLSAGLEPHEAAVIASRANRTAGEYAHARPDTRIVEIIGQIKPVFREHLCRWSGVCTVPKGEVDD